jgi:amino acid transporter
MDDEPGLKGKMKNFFIGKAIKPNDPKVFHNISLIAFFAWVGLGADGLTSSCYGPAELFVTLNQYKFLGVFLAIAIMITVTIISMSYSQIIELFPTGGGGYLVGSKLLSPTIGMISGCALMIDYVLTITTSIAGGIDALFSSFPPEWAHYKVFAGVFVILVLVVMNLRGVKESIMPLIPIFLIFVFSHFFLVIYGIFTHMGNFPVIASGVGLDIKNATMSLGFMGMIFMLLHSFSMGAGTYTGIEAVSNGMNIIREPKVRNAKKTMFYMAASLAFTAGGLIILFLLFQVDLEPGKTLNATAFEKITASWGAIPSGTFVIITMLSETLLLFVAAQTGFIGGPNILSNMSLDRWFPTRFSSLSDRLVTKDGILLMGGAALITMLLTGGSVASLLVLYSISVFITFTISQIGMVKYWWMSRKKIKEWKKKIVINGFGLAVTLFILVSVVVVKFKEGGWITLIIIALLVCLALIIKNYYTKSIRNLKRLDILVEQVNESLNNGEMPEQEVACDTSSKTAVILVSGFNGLGLHTLFNIIMKFANYYKNFVFIEAGIVDAGNFKGVQEVNNLEHKINDDIKKYVKYLNKQGFYAEGHCAVGTDVVFEIDKLAQMVLKKFPNSMFFGGQLVFQKESFFSRFLHNYTIFSVQRNLYHKGIPIVIMPIKV